MTCISFLQSLAAAQRDRLKPAPIVDQQCVGAGFSRPRVRSADFAVFLRKYAIENPELCHNSGSSIDNLPTLPAGQSCSNSAPIPAVTEAKACLLFPLGQKKPLPQDAS